MAAHAAEELHQIGVAGEETHPHAGQVRALGERVDGHHAVEAGLQHRPGRAVPGELGVALVGEHGNPVGSAPLRSAAGRPGPRSGWRANSTRAPGRGRHRRVDRSRSSLRTAAPDGAAPARPGTPPAQHPWHRSGTTPPDRARCHDRADAAGASGAPRPPVPWCPRRPPPRRPGRSRARSAAPARPRRPESAGLPADAG